MKTHSTLTFYLLCALLAISLSACSSATSPIEDAQVQANITEMQVTGEAAYPVNTDNGIHWLVASASDGLKWLDNKTDTISSLDISSVTLDWRYIGTSNQDILIAALDYQTTSVHLLHLDTKSGTFTQMLEIPAVLADIETVCLANHANQLTLFTADSLGVVEQSAIILRQESPLNGASTIPIRRLNVGPNLSHCYVNDESNRLYVGEEETGIWMYDAHPEAENERTFIPFASQAEIESFSVFHDQLVISVSPDENQIWLSDIRALDKVEHSAIGLDNAISLANIAMASTDNNIVLGGYDESQSRLYRVSFDMSPEHSSQITNPKLPADATFYANAQTHPVNRFGDAADDPAIWLNNAAPEKSLVFGTDKKYGLNVYDLSGKLVQSLASGRINNIDIRGNMAVASNRTYQSMTFFNIDESSGLASELANVPTQLNDVYGLCLYQNDEQLEVFINDTDGRFEHYAVEQSQGEISARLLDTFNSDSQPEGCIVDDATQTLYFGEESTGVWEKSLAQPKLPAVLIATVNERVNADIEGMGIYMVDGEKFLIVSSQGNNRFAVYAIERNNQLIGVFDIGVNYELGIDAVSETDGLEVISTPLGNNYPMGLLVVQDGRNVMPLEPQNFKLVSATQLYRFIKGQIDTK
ncbi:phytase [Glaciecola sp. XM2]|uniref:phytase n=1 Tax=Glaciecola sp. XM2 TaxID=1914931 RepID=UPI001BDF65BD|nr:phytase [Glaciecola sp. XM2]MBT1450602.1 phytase [Glaciecola sp. XM2]